MKIVLVKFCFFLESKKYKVFRNIEFCYFCLLLVEIGWDFEILINFILL